jgi:hypothetical protein
VPDRLWALLVSLGHRGGVLPFDDPLLDRKVCRNLKHSISAIRKRLKVLLPIEGDPFEPTRKRREYRSRFKIAHAGGVQFPTPGGAEWHQIDILETPAGRIRVTAETQETFPAYRRGGEGTRIFDAGVRASPLSREYDLRVLRLPGSQGAVLLEVLRARGTVKRPRGDCEMTLLGKFLCDFTGMEDSPFHFDGRQGIWKALFRANSFNSPDHR